MTVSDTSGASQTFVGSKCGVLTADALEAPPIDALTSWLITATTR